MFCFEHSNKLNLTAGKMALQKSSSCAFRVTDTGQLRNGGTVLDGDGEATTCYLSVFSSHKKACTCSRRLHPRSVGQHYTYLGQQQVLRFCSDSCIIANLWDATPAPQRVELSGWCHPVQMQMMLGLLLEQRVWNCLWLTFDQIGYSQISQWHHTLRQCSGKLFVKAWQDEIIIDMRLQWFCSNKTDCEVIDQLEFVEL